MRRVLFYGLPLLMVIAFILIMQSAAFLKRPHSEEDDVALQVNRFSAAVRAERWDEAERAASQTERAWREVIPRIQFGAERDEMNRLTTALARAKGYVSAHDRAGALAELAEVREHWRDIGS